MPIRRMKAIARRGAHRVGSLAGAKVSPLTNAARTRVSLYRSSKLLVESAVFDVEYYSAQTGTSYESAMLAARDYLLRGTGCLLAPNPLLEPRWFDPAGKRGAAVSTLHYVQHGPGRLGVGPLFDEQRYLTAHPDAAAHPGRALGHFLERADENTELPVPPTFVGTPPQWGVVRSAMLSVATTYTAAQDIRDGDDDRSWQTPAAADMVTEFVRAPMSEVGPVGSPALVDVIIVITPTTKPGQLAASLASLRAQNLHAWRAVAIVDAARPVPAELLDAAADRRFQIAKVPSTSLQSPGSARNAALPYATARYVTQLEPGRRWAAHTLKVLVAAAERSGRAAVCCAIETTNADKSVSVRAHTRGARWLHWRDSVDASGLLVARSRLVELGGFATELPSGETHDLAIRLERIEPIEFVPFVGVTERRVKDVAPQLNWAAIGRYHVDWDAMEAGLEHRVAGRVTVSMPTFRDWKMTLRAVKCVLTASGSHDIEVVVVDNGSPREVGSILTASFVGEPRVRVVSLPLNLNFSIGSNLGAALGTGDRVVFLNNDTEVLDGWLDPLNACLVDPTVRGAQPLLLYPDGTVQSAGSTLPGTGHPPTAFLAGFLPEDARRCGELRLRVVTAAALMMWASDIAHLHGFDPAYVNGQEDVDLCLRAVQRWGGRFAVATDSVVIHHESKSENRGAMIQPNRRLLVDRWQDRLYDSDLDAYQKAGFTVASLDYGKPLRAAWMVPLGRPVITRPARIVTTGPATGRASLRWALKLAAHPGPRGDGWGDVHFAAALGRSLERLGQEVVVDRRESRQRATNSIDQVAVVIRGLEHVAPLPGQVNILWVISHPELVTDDELASFDVVFAASTAWARTTSARTGLAIRPLLQATEPERFHPALRGTSAATGALFVGRSRNILRPIVRDSIEAGIGIEIYGDGWEQFGVGGYVKDQYIPYETVGSAYASADVVLNDHWADMAEQGFVSNRVFDAVACGARVVSDEVDGLEEMFGGSVKVYRTPGDLARLCGPSGHDAFADDATRLANAADVAERHSFDARAAQLLDAALDVRRQRGWER